MAALSFDERVAAGAGAARRHFTAELSNVLWGFVPGASTPPIGSVGLGEVFWVDTVSSEGLMPDQGRDPVTYFGRLGFRPEEVLADAVALAASDMRCEPPATGPHVVTGPIHVKGVRAGDVLEIDLVALEPRCAYGLVSNRHGKGALPERFPSPALGEGAVVTHLVTLEGSTLTLHGGRSRWARLPFAPCLGLIGMVAETAEPLHSVEPRASGGNLDLRFLGPGWTLLVRAAVDGGGVFVGDPHFAQGDGEVALTSVEGPLRVALRVRRAEAPSAARSRLLSLAPIAESCRWLVTLGLHEDLNEAVKAATASMVDLLAGETGMPEAVALSYLSAAGRCAVSQVVNNVKGVHLMIDKSHLSLAPPGTR